MRTGAECAVYLRLCKLALPAACRLMCLRCRQQRVSAGAQAAVGREAGPALHSAQVWHAHTAQPASRPRQLRTCHVAAGLIHIFAIMALLLITLFTQQGSPSAQLQPDSKYREQMFTQWRSVPYYVQSYEKFESKYPTQSVNRRQLERQVR